MQLLPQNVQSILDKYDVLEKSYANCEAMKIELEAIGWTCDYGLDAEVYGIEQIKHQHRYTDNAEECLYCGEKKILLIFNASEQCCPECNTKFEEEF